MIIQLDGKICKMKFPINSKTFLWFLHSGAAPQGGKGAEREGRSPGNGKTRRDARRALRGCTGRRRITQKSPRG